MASFREVIQASPERLINYFYRINPAPTADFIVRIDWAATQLQLNHAQLVCALGFNGNARNLTEILAILGFSSFKALSIRRNELFATDVYGQLDIDNVLDVYGAVATDPDFTAAIRENLPRRLATVEARIGTSDDPMTEVCYRMEIHAIYNGGLADKDFASKRLGDNLGRFRLVSEELAVIVENNFIPAPNAIYMDNLLTDEKRLLIDRGLVPTEIIRNRLANPAISTEERAMLESYA
jgi:hypothetical protein